MKKHMAQLFMAGILLVSVFFLSREGAQLVNKEIRKKGVIVVDCGHGGMDPGVIGVNQLKEKDINLAISKKLGKLLEEEGYEVVMTRKEDVGLYDSESRNKKVQDMQKRCQMIKETKPLLTVSIHQNSYPSAKVHGAQVFYYKDSEQGKRLAALLQDSLREKVDPDNHRQIKENCRAAGRQRGIGINGLWGTVIYLSS